MANYQETIDKEIAELKARLEQLSKTDISKLEEKKAKLQEQINAIDNEIAETLKAAGIETAKPKKEKGATRERLTPIEKDSDEWNRFTKHIQKQLSKAPDGLNGKALCASFSTEPLTPTRKKRYEVVINAICKKTGKGVSTRYFLK